MYINVAYSPSGQIEPVGRSVHKKLSSKRNTLAALQNRSTNQTGTLPDINLNSPRKIKIPIQDDKIKGLNKRAKH